MREYREDNIEVVVDAKIVDWITVDDPDGTGLSVNIPIAKLEFEGKEYKAIISNMKMNGFLHEKYKNMTSIAVVFNKSHPGSVTALCNEVKDIKKDKVTSGFTSIILVIVIGYIIFRFISALQ